MSGTNEQRENQISVQTARAGVGIKKEKITQEELKSILRYDPDTGLFHRIKKSQGGMAGEVIGCLKASGHIEIGINGRCYKAHRMAFLYMEGYFPENQVDHKNGKRSDNTWENLRHVTQTCNLQNMKVNKLNKSGFPGVHWHEGQRKWRSQITIGNKRIHIGYYQTTLEAALARFTFETQCDKWTCNYRSELAKAITAAWPEFSPS